MDKGSDPSRIASIRQGICWWMVFEVRVSSAPIKSYSEEESLFKDAKLKKTSMRQRVSRNRYTWKKSRIKDRWTDSDNEDNVEKAYESTWEFSKGNSRRLIV